VYLIWQDRDDLASIPAPILNRQIILALADVVGKRSDVAEVATKSVGRGPWAAVPAGRLGQSRGRPHQDVTALARANTIDAIEALVAALKRRKEAVPAAVALLNRG
jgi:hypothetical protein